MSFARGQVSGMSRFEEIALLEIVYLVSQCTSLNITRGSPVDPEIFICAVMCASMYLFNTPHTGFSILREISKRTWTARPNLAIVRAFECQLEVLSNDVAKFNIWCGTRPQENSKPPFVDWWNRAEQFLPHIASSLTSFPLFSLKRLIVSSLASRDELPVVARQFSALWSIILRKFYYRKVPLRYVSVMNQADIQETGSTSSLDAQEVILASESETEMPTSPPPSPKTGKSSMKPKKVIQKRKKSAMPRKDTSTSTTAVTTMAPGVAAASYEESESSGDDWAAKYCTAATRPKNTGITGCNISLKHRGELFSWRATKYPAKWDAYVDFKVYNDLKALQTTEPMQAWRLAAFRGKMAIGNPLDPSSTRRVKAAVKELQEAMLEAAQVFPGVTLDRAQS